MYRIFFTKQAKKFLKKCEEKERLLKAIKILGNNPFSQAKRVVNKKEKTFRWRVGAFRILFTPKNNDIIIVKIEKRPKAYS